MKIIWQFPSNFYMGLFIASAVSLPDMPLRDTIHRHMNTEAIFMKPNVKATQTLICKESNVQYIFYNAIQFDNQI